MEAAQKRAFIAILSMIESGIQQLKMLLSVDDSESFVQSEAPRPSAEPGHLDEIEERMLEEQLERERQSLIKFEQGRVQTLWGDLDE